VSAVRYSGRVRVRLTYVDAFADWAPNGRYRAVVRLPSGAAYATTIGAPRVLACAVDCPRAFDEAARVALTLASAECPEVDAQAESDGAGFVVRRMIPVSG
jgi:hypothetical protein